MPPPRFILRRQVVLSTLADVPRGRLIEIGCGSGALLADFARMGFYGLGVDTSREARELARRIVSASTEFEIADTLENVGDHTCDYVLALEVLEHIEFDIQALVEWKRKLSPGGLLVVSVPSNPERWSADDVWAGHYRRYTRTGISEKLINVGFESVAIRSYGWPLTVISDPVRSIVRRRQLDRRHAAAGGTPDQIEERSARSGIDRRTEAKMFTLYSNRFAKAVFRMLFLLQDMASKTDWGTGYVVLARRPGETPSRSSR